jgi:hypothetical protein
VIGIVLVVVLVLDTFPSICNRRLIRICGRNALGGGSRTQIEDEDDDEDETSKGFALRWRTGSFQGLALKSALLRLYPSLEMSR